MNAKRILALIGAILLLALYASTLVFALMKNPASQDLLKASILSTILLPILIYAMQLIYRVLKNRDK